MKAIVSVNPKSSYSRLNGLTFDVIEILSSLIVLNVNGKTIDFTYQELLIVDINIEIQKAKNDADWNSSYLKTFENLKKYCEINKIEYVKPIFKVAY